MLKTVFALFTGPAGVVGEFFAGLYGKIIGILAIVGVISVALGSIYFSFKDSIQSAEDSKLALQVQKHIVKSKDDEIKRIKALDALKEKTQAAEAAQTKSVDDSSAAVQDWIQKNGTGAADRPASDVITQTFDRLYGKAK